MPQDLAQDRRPQLVATLGLLSLTLWLLVGPTRPPPPRISTWHADGLLDPPVAAAPAADSRRTLAEPPQQPAQAHSGNGDARQGAQGQPLIHPSDQHQAAHAQPAPAATAHREARQAVNAALAAAAQPQDVPWGNPTGSARAVLTQGYDVGTHAPASIWGGLDLAIDADGDGQANPEATWHHPVYATLSGVVDLRPHSLPAGHHVWITNKRYKVGYGHLQRFAVKEGQQVKRGDLIGYIGATGVATGPHLHYHIWEDGRNVNPLDFGTLSN